MKDNKVIKKVLKDLEKYNIKNLFAEFKCFTDGMAIFEVRTINYNYKKKYTTEFKCIELVFDFHVIGLSDILDTMPVLDLVTDKGIEYVSVTVTEMTRENGEDTEKSVDCFGMSSDEPMTDEDMKEFIVNLN